MKIELKAFRIFTRVGSVDSYSLGSVGKALLVVCMAFFCVAVSGCSSADAPILDQRSPDGDSATEVAPTNEDSTNLDCLYTGPDLTAAEFFKDASTFTSERHALELSYGISEPIPLYVGPGSMLTGDDSGEFPRMLDSIPPGGLSRFFQDYCAADPSMDAFVIRYDVVGFTDLDKSDLVGLDRDLFELYVEYKHLMAIEWIWSCIQWDKVGHRPSREEEFEVYNDESFLDLMDSAANNLCPQFSRR